MPDEKLRIRVHRHSVFYSPLLSTVAGRFLRDVGLDAVYSGKPPERKFYELFRNNEVDIMQAAPSSNWDALSRGIRDLPLHFAQINQRDGFFLVSRLPAKTFEWKNLETASLLADHLAQPLAMLKYALDRRGIDWTKIHAIDAGSPESMESAFRKGTGDYIHLQGPRPQQLEQEGLGKVVAAIGEVIPPVAFSSLMAMPDFLKSERARAFTRAYRRALGFVMESPAAEVAALEAQFFPGLSKEVMTAAISRYQQLGCWRSDPAIPREQYEVALDVFLHSGEIKQRYAYEDVVVPPPA